MAIGFGVLPPSALPPLEDAPLAEVPLPELPPPAVPLELPSALTPEFSAGPTLLLRPLLHALAMAAAPTSQQPPAHRSHRPGFDTALAVAGGAPIRHSTNVTHPCASSVQGGRNRRVPRVPHPGVPDGERPVRAIAYLPA